MMNNKLTPPPSPEAPARRARELPVLFSGSMVQAILDGRKNTTRRVVAPQPINLEMPWPNDQSHATFEDILKRQDYYVQCGYYPYGKIGDRLYVREAWRTRKSFDSVKPSALANGAPIEYAAGGTNHASHYSKNATHLTPNIIGEPGKLRPAIFLPKWASRLWLEITSIRLERLQELTAEEAQLEGIQLPARHNPGDPPDKGHRIERISGKYIPSDYIPASVPRPLTTDLCGAHWYLAHFASLWDGLNAERFEGSRRGVYAWKANPFVWVIKFKRVQIIET